MLQPLKFKILESLQSCESNVKTMLWRGAPVLGRSDVRSRTGTNIRPGAMLALAAPGDGRIPQRLMPCVSRILALNFPPMKIVLAYSGGLDTSVILSWIREKYDAEIIAFCANIGQEEELDGLHAKARKTGASKCYIVDLEREFARDFIFPMIQAGAVYEGQYFLGTSIARPLIAKGMIEVARKEKADALAHGATGKGNDQVRFELTAAALAPELQVIAPWRDARFRDQFPGRAEMIDYCEEKRIPVQASVKKPYSMDRNLLHISFESGMLEDPWFDASGLQARDMYKLSASPEDAPGEPEYVELQFRGGNCIAVNHRSISPLKVMQSLNMLGGK